jgi:hypothetical protein
MISKSLIASLLLFSLIFDFAFSSTFAYPLNENLTNTDFVRKETEIRILKKIRNALNEIDDEDTLERDGTIKRRIEYGSRLVKNFLKTLNSGIDTNGASRHIFIGK